MTDEEQSARKAEIIEELKVLLQEWVHITDGTDGTTGILTGAVVSWEATRFQDDGTQVFRTSHITLPPTSNAAVIGLLQDSLWDVHHMSFAHCGPTNTSN